MKACKGKIVALIVLLALVMAQVAWAGTQTLTISSDPGADSFTTAAMFGGRFNVSVSGTWAGTVHLQRSFDGGTTWVDVDSFTANIEATVDEPQQHGLPYRIGMKNGNYTSGTVYLRLTK